MTTTSALDAAISYLATAATAAYGSGVQVVDGPMVQDTGDVVQSRVWIGYDPENPDQSAAAADQQFATLGARTRNETGEIVCAVEYWAGDATPASARAAARGLLATFEQLLRGTPATGGPGDCTLGGAVLWSQISGGISLSYQPGPQGVIARLVFHVGYLARLTTT